MAESNTNSSPTPTGAGVPNSNSLYSEETLRKLKEFAVSLEANPESVVAPPELAEVMTTMKTFGVPLYPWDDLVGLMSYCLSRGLDQFRNSHKNDAKYGKHLSDSEYNQYKHRLLLALEEFDGAPFTLQRICELVLEPEKHYRNLDKLLFGLEKLLSVSTVLQVATGNELTKLQEAGEEIRSKEDISLKSQPNLRQVFESGDVEMSIGSPAGQLSQPEHPPKPAA